MAKLLTFFAVLAVTIAVAEAYLFNIQRGPDSQLSVNADEKPKLDELIIHLIASDTDDNSVLKSELLEKISNHVHLHLPCILTSSCNITKPNPPTTVEPATEAPEVPTTVKLVPTTTTTTTTTTAQPSTTTPLVPYRSVEDFVKVLPQEFQDKLASYFKIKSILDKIYTKPLAFPRRLRTPIFD